MEELGNSAKRREADFGAENKALEREITELKDEIKLAKKEVKILKKESNKSEHDFFKKSEIFESKIRNLMKFKSEKVSDEKNTKLKEKFS